MSDRSERSSSIPWPPIIYVAAAAIAIILAVFYPMAWLPSPLAELAFATGVVIIAGAVFIEFKAMQALKQGDTTVLPTKRSDHLVTDGPYSFTRNPIYLGNTMLMIGAGFVFGVFWFFLAAIIAAFVTTKLAIEPEEKHLEHRFGKAFRDYRKKVRRWV
ncbi:MAG: isoprenylcysteine carboxylmethyltransferase family protein [Rhizobiaceae bacterium]